MVYQFGQDNNQQPITNTQSNGIYSFGSSGQSKQEQSKSEGLTFKGNPLENTAKNLNSITAGITTLAGGILGFDPQARQALKAEGEKLLTQPGEAGKDFVNAILSTYNLALDDFGNMPLGDMVGNILTGAWEHPIDAALDFVPLVGMASKGVKGVIKGTAKAASVIDKESDVSKFLNNIHNKLDEGETITRLAEEVTKENLTLGKIGEDYLKEMTTIAKRYTPDVISKSIQAMETVGFKNAPTELLSCMKDLNVANDTYKMFTKMAGAEILDDVEMATRELIAKEHGITFESARKIGKDTHLYQDMEKYVIDNDVRPVFHLEPKVKEVVSTEEGIKSNILERKFGNMNYSDAGKDILGKAERFVDKVTKSVSIDSGLNVNKKIREYNKLNNTNIKELPVSSMFSNSKVLNELNAELKKTMLGGGVYLGANILTTTLSILNNFNLKAAVNTLKDLPKFRLVELTEATTPGLRLLSRVNNITYRPIASVDRWLERVAAKYITEYGIDKAPLLQSTIATKVPITSEAEAALRTLVPFGSYPAAAMKETAAHAKLRPVKTIMYNQLQKEGQQLNEQTQANFVPGLKEVDPTKAIRTDDQGRLIQRQTIVTPIQAANMFLLGQTGDAVQIPIYNFINNLVSGKGDPNVFTVNGKNYRVRNGKIETNKGSFDLLPSLAYVGRQLLTPVQFYNQVITPLMSDKYIKDETKLFNRLVDDTQYSNMGSRAQRKVTDNAKEKLGKRVLGTYEYNYYDDSKVYKSVKRKVKQQLHSRQRIDRALNSNN